MMVKKKNVIATTTTLGVLLSNALNGVNASGSAQSLDNQSLDNQNGTTAPNVTLPEYETWSNNSSEYETLAPTMLDLSSSPSFTPTWSPNGSTEVPSAAPSWSVSDAYTTAPTSWDAEHLKVEILNVKRKGNGVVIDIELPNSCNAVLYFNPAKVSEMFLEDCKLCEIGSSIAPTTSGHHKNDKPKNQHHTIVQSHPPTHSHKNNHHPAAAPTPVPTTAAPTPNPTTRTPPPTHKKTPPPTHKPTHPTPRPTHKKHEAAPTAPPTPVPTCPPFELHQKSGETVSASSIAGAIKSDTQEFAAHTIDGKELFKVQNGSIIVTEDLNIPIHFKNGCTGIFTIKANASNDTANISTNAELDLDTCTHCKPHKHHEHHERTAPPTRTQEDHHPKGHHQAPPTTEPPTTHAPTTRAPTTHAPTPKHTRRPTHKPTRPTPEPTNHHYPHSQPTPPPSQAPTQHCGCGRELSDGHTHDDDSTGSSLRGAHKPGR